MDENTDGVLLDGTHVVTISSWHEFHQKVCSLKCNRGYVWRGQKEDWPLQSSFDREFGTLDQHERDRKLKGHLERFKEEMNKLYPGVVQKADDDEVWALGRHYGLKAPLLDWTLSPYIAAYFAFSEGIERNDSRYRYVYALNRSLQRLLSKKKQGNQVKSSARLVDFIDRLPYPSPRFTAQRGIFTKALQGLDLWKSVQAFSRKRPSEVVIAKFRIPREDREECLRGLQLMNIDHMSLLLDLHDVVDCCNSTL